MVSAELAGLRQPTELAYVLYPLPHLHPKFRVAHLYDLLALRMSPNAASTQPEKQSLDYIIRSGLAGGVAGCVVRLSTSALFSS